MDSELVIVAHIEANADQLDLVKSELQKLIPPTLEEEGCLQYDLHQDHENPLRFLFFERWQNRDLWQDHMNSPHIAALQAATEGAIANVEVQEMGRVS